MLIVSLIHGRNIIVTRQGGVLSIVDSTNELLLDVNINLAHVSYPENFRMELCCVTKRQKRQPSIDTSQMTLIGKAGRHSKFQLIVIALLTSIMPYPTPQRPTGFEDLGGRLPGEARLAHRIVHHELERKIAPNQRKPKTVRRIGTLSHITTNKVQEAATEENMEECTAINHC